MVERKWSNKIMQWVFGERQDLPSLADELPEIPTVNMFNIKDTSILSGADVKLKKIENCAVADCGELATSRVRLADDQRDYEAGGYSLNTCSYHREIVEKVKYSD